MLKSERRDQKRDRRLAKARRASNRKALFVLQQATAQRLGLNPRSIAHRNRLSHTIPLPSFPRKRESRNHRPPPTVIPA